MIFCCWKIDRWQIWYLCVRWDMVSIKIETSVVSWHILLGLEGIVFNSALLVESWWQLSTWRSGWAVPWKEHPKHGSVLTWLQLLAPLSSGFHWWISSSKSEMLGFVFLYFLLIYSCVEVGACQLFDEVPQSICFCNLGFGFCIEWVLA